MSNKRRSFSRLDAQNNRIPGSSVERKQMPKTGRWVEDLPFNQCCFPYSELSTIPEDVTDRTFLLTILCDATTVFSSFVTTTEDTTTIEELAALLNAQLGYLGAFEVDGADIVFKLKTEISDNFSCRGTLTYTVAPTALPPA